MWGPPLIATVSDSTLVTPLRQPALNLVTLILACDTSALLTLVAAPIRYCPPPLPDEEGGEHQLVAPMSGGPLPRWQVGKAADVAAGEADTWQSAPAIWTELFFRTPPPSCRRQSGRLLCG